MSSLRPDAVALTEAEENSGDAAGDFFPLDDNNVEPEPPQEEHVDRHQVTFL